MSEQSGIRGGQRAVSAAYKKYVSMASTAQQRIAARAAITYQNDSEIKTPSGCEVKRMKRTRWMPRQSEAMKDVLICEKRR